MIVSSGVCQKAISSILNRLKMGKRKLVDSDIKSIIIVKPRACKCAFSESLCLRKVLILAKGQTGKDSL